MCEDNFGLVYGVCQQVWI